MLTILIAAAYSSKAPRSHVHSAEQKDARKESIAMTHIVRHS